MIKRLLPLSKQPTHSFFLWGPRQTGKSFLLKATYPTAFWTDLLKTDEFIRYTQQPSRLREELVASGDSRLVIIDEIQKVPALLDEVHWLMENTPHIFGLCGSSARKVRRGHANLLGGRAIRYELFGLVSAELETQFDLLRLLNHGYLPRHYVEEAPQPLLRAYVNDYLKEEIANEGLVRNLPAFAQFLSVAALSDTELINYTTIARECGISGPAVKEYFQILVDTLLGRYLPAYTKRPKRRVIQAPKFYFADVGVVNVLTKRGHLEPGTELFGKAFENWVFHELSAHATYSERFDDLSYWRLASGIEVDFIINDMEIALEVKGSTNIATHHLHGLRELKQEHRHVKRRIVVCLEPRPRRTEDGIDILPVASFLTQLWGNTLFP
ncbi:MAG: ATP-binding protein [Deltaproteobacteria bacterium]|nr:ATP-binding protein [Deltaproteobacteria bacterium]